jgi:dihydrofolate reductase
MSKLRVHGFTLSADGYGAGPGQDLKNPLGVGGTSLHQWLVTTEMFQRAVLGHGGGTTGLDNDLALRGVDGIGAWILGRNMFGPVRGPWPDESWKGWWGDNPPYRTPVFVLTHHARPSLEMAGGTMFHFVSGGIHETLKQARAAAAGKDVRVGGGVATVRQYLTAGLIDEMHLAISPVVLGSGESLLAGLDLLKLGLSVAESVTTPAALHIVLRRTSKA